MNIPMIFVLLFGVFTLIGGVMGYVQAGSMASIVAGSVSGILLLVCAAGIYRGNRIAAIGALVISLLLGGRFLMTLVKNFKVMPDFLMVLFSLATILVVIQFLLKKG